MNEYRIFNYFGARVVAVVGDFERIGAGRYRDALPRLISADQKRAQIVLTRVWRIVQSDARTVGDVRRLALVRVHVVHAQHERVKVGVLRVVAERIAGIEWKLLHIRVAIGPHDAQDVAR